MKKAIFSLAFLSIVYSETQACAWYDPDYEYFNLFTQTIIRDKSYTPFLLSYSSRFYGDEKVVIPNENIEAWQKFFGNQLNYKDTEYLVNHSNINELQKLKNGSNSSDALLSKLGPAFYNKNQEAMDYLIQAKYMEPYMRINYVESEDSFYYRGNDDPKNATQLDYAKTVAALNSLYSAAKNPEIKLRYGYQLVRFNHYTRNYQAAIDAFQKYVAPLNLKSAPYYLALDQMAGAQRGLQNYQEANWNFFQVFMKSKAKKQDAFVSMQLSDTASFNNILKRAQTNEEKNMAYFLLGYQDFNNPLSMMEKMYDIDPNSEMLKVMMARSINELERNYLPTYYYENAKNPSENSEKKDENATTETSTKEEKTEEKTGWWSKVVNWFKNLFGSDSNEKTERSNDLSDKQYLNNPDRIPFYNTSEYAYRYDENYKPQDYLVDLEKFTEKTKNKSNDEFWKISDAYLKFLNKDFEESSEILNDIKTTDKAYLEQIQRMKMLNEIVSEPKITPEFEEKLYKDYKEFFVEPAKPESDSLSEEEYEYSYNPPSTREFLQDVLANRYFLQGEDAKSFLMNNQLSDLRYNPNLEMAKSLQSFFNKKDKTTFEKEIIAKQIDDVGDTEAFFNVIYGDFAMRDGDFKNAKKYYEKGHNFSGVPVYDSYWDYETGENVKRNTAEMYNGFKNINPLIFGHNVWVSYGSSVDESMDAEAFVGEFPFIKEKMNKLDLANAALELEKVGKGKGETAAKANQLLGNLLYNTSKLGYFREVFVMDSDNSNGGKYYFDSEDENPFKFYYKNYSYKTFIKPDNFDLAINYYNNALKNTANNEQKARILFQMASAEQGKYYQWETNQSEISYDDKDWSKKRDQQELSFAQTKNEKYRTYFTQLKQNYSNTELAKSLMGSCSYFDYFMKK